MVVMYGLHHQLGNSALSRNDVDGGVELCRVSSLTHFSLIALLLSFYSSPLLHQLIPHTSLSLVRLFYFPIFSHCVFISKSQH